MINKQQTVDIEAVKWHVLLQLYRSDKPVSVGRFTHELLGFDVNFNDVYDSLFQLNHVHSIEGGIQLTEEGRHYLENELKEERKRILHWITENKFDLAVLSFLRHRPHLVKLQDFPELLLSSAPQHGNSVGTGNLRQVILQLGGYIENPSIHWYGITQDGRDYYETMEAKATGPVPRRPSSAADVVTENDKQEMNARLDEILRKLEQQNLKYEAMRSDMKADFEELRNLFHLGKKNWRQLLVGKVTEWIAGGIVSETISKEIVDFIKNPTGKLLG